jgi:hypothetical protein
MGERPFGQQPALVVRDLVRDLFHRLGMVRAILLASALVFGALAGGVVVHRLETTSTAANGPEQGDKADQQGDKPTKPAKTKHPNQGHQESPEPDDGQDKDA